MRPSLTACIAVIATPAVTPVQCRAAAQHHPRAPAPSAASQRRGHRGALHIILVKIAGTHVYAIKN
jgi:hypothetical protein